MKIFKRLITVLTLSTLGFAFTSNATLITSWDWNVDSAFTATTADGPGAISGTGGNLAWGNSPSKISWGTSTGLGQSYLEIGGNNGSGNSTGTSITDGLSAITSTLEHKNNPITGTTLDTAILSTRLTLTPGNPAGPVLTPLQLFFGINFLETPNSGTCVVPSTEPCDDIFVITPTGPFNQQFTLDDITYNVGLVVDNLNPLSSAACSAVGIVGSCEGFTTQEGQDNFFNVNMTITTVPEPSTVLLLSLALLGIVVSTRNKHTS